MEQVESQLVNAHSMRGKGPLCVVLCEDGRYAELSASLEDHLQEHFTILPVRIRASSHLRWEVIVDELERALSESGKRQFRFVVFGHACSYLFALGLRNKKLFRWLVVLDGEFRTESGRAARFIEALENRLPLGLPFRLKSDGFSAMPFLQRMRFPTLVATSKSAGRSSKEAAEILNQLLPISWSLPEACSEGELVDAIVELEDVPLKRPQKNREQKIASSVGEVSSATRH